MSIQAYQLLANAPQVVLPQVLALFSKTAAQVCEGQQYDMNFENIPYITMLTKLDLANLFNKNISSFGITDENLAKKFEENLNKGGYHYGN